MVNIYMLLTIFIALYSIFFLFIAWYYFRYGAALLIIGLPSYLIRFSVGPLPTTVLELMLAILLMVWLIKFAREDLPKIKSFVIENKFLAISCLIFLFSSLGSIFVSDMWFKSLGQWRAFFLEPFLLFIMLVGRTPNNNVYQSTSNSDFQKIYQSPHNSSGQTANNSDGQKTNQSPDNYGGQKNEKITAKQFPSNQSTQDVRTLNELVRPIDLVWALALSTISIGIFGIIQSYTGWHIGTVDWVALQTGRTTSFFLSPNAVGLYLGPLVPFLLLLSRKFTKGRPADYLAKGALLLCLATIFLSQSVGAFAALAIGLLLYFFALGYKKGVLVVLVTTAIVGCLLLFTPYHPQLLQNKNQSGSNRLTLWSYSAEYLTQSPKNFFLGTGIRQFFRKIQKPHYDVKKMERLIYPHNVLLNFWTEIGLFGMVSFVGIFGSLVWMAFGVYQRKLLWGASLLAVLAIWFIHGLIDVPYFKNDLAMEFWIMAAIITNSI